MSVTQIKLCSKCGINERRNDHSWCNPCNRQNASERRWNPKTREALLKREREYRKTWLYGITTEEYNMRVIEQEGKCAICKKDCANLFVDHCHSSGKIRGLLCNICNAGIGLLGDTTQSVTAALAYLIEREETL